MNLSIINMGCINEKAMQNNFLNKMKLYDINRATSLEESDYLLYITCAGVGETIQDVINELYILDMYSKEHNLKIIVVGCLLINHEYLFERFKSNPNIKFINKRDWMN